MYLFGAARPKMFSFSVLLIVMILRSCPLGRTTQKILQLEKCFSLLHLFFYIVVSTVIKEQCMRFSMRAFACWLFKKKNKKKNPMWCWSSCIGTGILMPKGRTKVICFQTGDSFQLLSIDREIHYYSFFLHLIFLMLLHCSGMRTKNTVFLCFVGLLYVTKFCSGCFILCWLPSSVGLCLTQCNTIF